MCRTKTPDDTCRVLVFCESPAWDKVDRWWKLPADVVDELYKGSWNVDEFYTSDDIQYIRDQYPDSVVLIY